MKKNSGAALTSVIVVFLLVMMILVPLLGAVVYNYRFREYDSGAKEAEYINEIIMDRISTIIKNNVVLAISNSKDDSARNINLINDALINTYNKVYDSAVDSVPPVPQDTIDEEEINRYEQAVRTEIKNRLVSELQGNLDSDVIEGTSLEDIIKTLKMDDKEFDELHVAKINDEELKNVRNSMFSEKYHSELIGDGEGSGIFYSIYNDLKVDDLDIDVSKVKFGTEEMDKDPETGATLGRALKVKSTYMGWDGTDRTYIKNTIYTETPSFDEESEKLRIGIESTYRLNSYTPVTTLSATFVIGTPDIEDISSVKQQTVALSNPTLDYGIIVGKKLTIDGEVNVDGNILALANNNDSEGIDINSGASLKAKRGSNISDSRIATPGDIIMRGNTVLETGTNPIYYRNLYLGSLNEDAPIQVSFNGDVLAKDDLEINSDSVTVTQESGSYFGFNDKNNEGPDSSSAIVINSGAIGGIRLGLNDLYLAGRAFIDGVRSATRRDSNGNALIYKTGESISVKGNYIAYQTPLVDSNLNIYDVDKVKFSQYFMKGQKVGMGEDAEFTVNFVDRFIDIKEGENEKTAYGNFDVNNKWQYFTEYDRLNRSSLRKPEISVNRIKYMQGAGIVSGEVVGQETSYPQNYAVMIEKGKRFEEFTKYFGYYPKDESKRKENISDWIKFGENSKQIQDDNFFVYISERNAGNKSLGWGSFRASSNIPINVQNGEINGIIIYDGDLTIKSDSEIPFNGLIIVTGNLVIENDANIISNKDLVSEIIMKNYLGSEYVYNGSLEKGDLFNVFTYDGSGSTYVAIDVVDRSNMLNINDLIGITNWKKTGYGM